MKRLVQLNNLSPQLEFQPKTALVYDKYYSKLTLSWSHRAFNPTLYSVKCDLSYILLFCSFGKLTEITSWGWYA